MIPDHLLPRLPEPVAQPTARPLPDPPTLTPPPVEAWIAHDPDGLLAPLPPVGTTALAHLARAGAVLRLWRPSTAQARRAEIDRRLAGGQGSMQAQIQAWLAGLDMDTTYNLSVLSVGLAQALAVRIADEADADPSWSVAEACQQREDLERAAWALATVGAHAFLRDVLRGIDRDVTPQWINAAIDHSPILGAEGYAILRVDADAWWVGRFRDGGPG